MIQIDIMIWNDITNNTSIYCNTIKLHKPRFVSYFKITELRSSVMSEANYLLSHARQYYFMCSGCIEVVGFTIALSEVALDFEYSCC